MGQGPGNGSTGPENSGEAPMAQPGPILIVDDEASIRKSLEGVLGDEGYSCALAPDGAEALARLRELRPSLVLLDIWMPGMDGIETLRRIKTLSPGTPVIMMSGHATISTAIKATKVGASDFIEKPLEIELVLNAIRRALGTPEAGPGAPETEPESPDGARAPGAAPRLHPVVFEKQTMRG